MRAAARNFQEIVDPESIVSQKTAQKNPCYACAMSMDHSVMSVLSDWRETRILDCQIE
jgi:hypothetical protein